MRVKKNQGDKSILYIYCSKINDIAAKKEKGNKTEKKLTQTYLLENPYGVPLKLISLLVQCSCTSKYLSIKVSWSPSDSVLLFFRGPWKKHYAYWRILAQKHVYGAVITYKFTNYVTLITLRRLILGTSTTL